MTKLKMKLMDGLKVITSDGVHRMHKGGFRALWKYMGWDIDKNEMASKCASEITRQLICFGRVDLSEFTEPRSTFIVEVIPANNFKVQYREIGSCKWKDLDDTYRYENEAKEEVKRLTETTDRDLEFRVARWE